MKKITTLLLLTGVSGLLSAGNLQLLENGNIELDGWRATPTTYTENWHGLQPAADRQIFKRIKSENGVLFQMDFTNGTAGKLALALEGEERVVSSVEMERGTLVKPFCLNSLLPVSRYRGTSFEVDGKIYQFPKEFTKEALYAGSAKRFRIPVKNGEILIEGNYYLRVQDDRKWDGSTFNIRLGYTPYTGGIQKSKISLRIRQGKAGEFGKNLGSVTKSVYKAKADGNWKAFTYTHNVKPGSALDFSARLDAPAGKYGPVILNADGNFVFRDSPEKTVRFYGPNLVGTSQIPDKKLAEEMADRFASFGFNVIRFHHHDDVLFDHTGKAPDRLNAANMDKFDYLASCLKKRGIYYTTDIYVSRNNISAPELGDLGKITNVREYKALFYIDDRVFNEWKRWAGEFLGHVNPYTGLALKDDPALITLSLVNEANPGRVWGATPRSEKMYREKFAEWKKSNPDKSFEQFISFRAVTRFEEMKAALREIGCGTLLSDQNYRNNLTLSADRKHYDFVDNHGYWDHPRFAETPWKLPVLADQRNVLGALSGIPDRLFPSRLYGKGFTVTEFGYANPNLYRAVGPALMAAYGAFQSWDALFPFAYAHWLPYAQKPTHTAGFFDITNDPVKAYSQRIGAQLFLNAGIRPAETRFAGIATDPFRKDGDTESPLPFNDLGFLAQIGLVAELPTQGEYAALINLGIGSAQSQKTFPAKKDLIDNLLKAGLLPKGCYDAKTGRFTAPGGQIELIRKQKTFRVTAPGGEVLATGTVRKLDGKNFSVENKNDFGVFALLPVDAQTLAEARRFTLIHLTNTQATGMEFATKDCDRLENWGKAPFLAQHGIAKVALNLKGEWKAYALNCAGERIGSLPVTEENGKNILNLDNFAFPEAVFAYELER